MTTVTRIFELSEQLQPWRTEAMTIAVMNAMAKEGVPFCESCADWHTADDVHSITEWTLDQAIRED
jgi:hypothetical protein